MIILPFICIIVALCCVVVILVAPGRHHHSWGKWENSQLTVLGDGVFSPREVTVSAQRRYCATCNKKKVRRAT